jgi:trimeric autotransporter adhesin
MIVKNLMASVFVCASLACGQGIIMTVAGNGTAGFSGDGGTATSAQLNFTTSTATGTLEAATANPKGVAVDTAGNVYFADFGNERIRKVSPGGNITTVAGNGIAGFSGDGGPAISAEICTPEGIWLDSTGNLYIADEDGYARKISLGGTISTLAGIGGAGYSGDGGPAAQAGLYWPSGVARDMAGNLYISDTRNNRRRFRSDPAAPRRHLQHRSRIAARLLRILRRARP